MMGGELASTKIFLEDDYIYFSKVDCRTELNTIASNDCIHNISLYGKRFE